MTTTKQNTNEIRTITNEVGEANINLLEENEKLLHEHAQELLTKISLVLADRRAVEAANAADAELLRGMAAEIEKLDAAVDPNNLDALQNLVARRDQLARLSKKYAAEAKEHLATADGNIAALDLTNELIALIQEGRLVALEKLSMALRPYFSNDYLAGQFVMRTECLAKVSQFLTHTPNHVGTVVEIENAVRDLIQPIASGTPPWFFTREPIAHEN